MLADGVTATPFEGEMNEEAVGSMAVGEQRFGLGVTVFADFSDPANVVLSCIMAARTLPAAVGAGGRPCEESKR